MTATRRTQPLTMMLVLFLILTLAILAPPILIAQDTGFEAGQANSIEINLQRYMGKRVKLKLKTGSDLDGVVTKVGTNAVHIAELSGMEFYDALVRIDHISAVVIKMRTK